LPFSILMPRLGFWVAYDGTGFHGFAPNPEVSTVAGVMQQALKTMFRLPGLPPMICAGRTDAGVHGHGQVATVDLPDGAGPQVDGGLNIGAVKRSMNKLCRDAVVIWHVAVVPDDFDARFSATSRSYRYRILNAPHPDPLRLGQVWHVWDPLDLDRMNAAAQHVLGGHDFSCFCRRRVVPTADGPVEASRFRRVTRVGWRTTGAPCPTGQDLVFEISAGSFCTQMVRSIVGTTVDVGRGWLEPDDMVSIMDSRDRTVAGTVAPPEGLVLSHVGYPPANYLPASRGGPEI